MVAHGRKWGGTKIVPAARVEQLQTCGLSKLWAGRGGTRSQVRTCARPAAVTSKHQLTADSRHVTAPSSVDPMTITSSWRCTLSLRRTSYSRRGRSHLTHRATTFRLKHRQNNIIYAWQKCENLDHTLTKLSAEDLYTALAKCCTLFDTLSAAFEPFRKLISNNRTALSF